MPPVINQLIHSMVLNCGWKLRCETIFSISLQFQESILLGYTVVLEPHSYVIFWCGRVINMERGILQAIFLRYLIKEVFDISGMISINSLSPGEYVSNCESIIFQLIMQYSIWSTKYEIIISWMSQNFTNEKWTLVEVMAWCHHVTSRHLNQCWPRSLSPYGIIRPQWVTAEVNYNMVHTFINLFSFPVRMGNMDWLWEYFFGLFDRCNGNQKIQIKNYLTLPQACCSPKDWDILMCL